MGNSYSSPKGFRNVGLMLRSVVWKADETETCQVLDQLQLNFPQQQEERGNPPSPNKPKTEGNNEQKETGIQSQKENIYIREGKKK